MVTFIEWRSCSIRRTLLSFKWLSLIKPNWVIKLQYQPSFWFCFILTVGFLSEISHDSFRQVEVVRQADSCHALKTSGSSDAQGRPTRRWTDQGLYQLVSPPLQETRQQKLSEYLPPFVHSPSVKHSVSLKFSCWKLILWVKRNCNSYNTILFI